MQLIGDQILISDQALNYLRNYLESQNYSRVFVLVDENTDKFCLPHIPFKPDHVIRIEAGEQAKNLDSCTRIWDELLHSKADRSSVLINLGGGMVGDIGGFCATTFKRGMDFIQVPTSLLAMVDASVGGKTGIDYRAYKNLIGAFSEPHMVFIQPNLLDTLPDREYKAGYAEMLKHGLISDQEYWKELAEPNKRRIKRQIERSVRIKKEITEEDPRESGVRKLLNFGHTIGHGIESFCLENGRDVLHGEAVAAGMIMESIISAKTGLTHEDLSGIREILGGLYKRVPVESDEAPEIWNFILGDKKNKAGKVNCTLLLKPGKAAFDIPIHFPEFREAFQNYLSGY